MVEYSLVVLVTYVTFKHMSAEFASSRSFQEVVLEHTVVEVVYVLVELVV